LLEINVLEELNKYSSFVSSSLQVVKLISVETTDDGSSLSLLTACSLFSLQLQLPFECINFFEKEGQDFFPCRSLASKQALLLFCCLNLAIALQSDVSSILRGQLQSMIYERLFHGLDLVCQTEV
jgi:hypothetical protein